MQASGAELASIQSGIRNLSIGQESLTRRADEQEAALDQMKREFKQLERELQEIKSAPPTRHVSPVQTPRSGYASSDSPRFSGQREVDELQIVIGGWSEAKRDAIEGDVRNMFEALRAGALLKAVYAPYVRSGLCRVELVYADQDLWARRKLRKDSAISRADRGRSPPGSGSRGTGPRRKGLRYGLSCRCKNYV